MVPREVAPATSAVSNCHATAMARPTPRLRLQQATAGREPDGSEEQRGDSPHDNYDADGFESTWRLRRLARVLVRALAPPMSQWPPRTIPSNPSTATTNSD